MLFTVYVVGEHGEGRVTQLADWDSSEEDFALDIGIFNSDVQLKIEQKTKQG